MSDGEICARHFATGQPVRVRWEAGVLTNLSPADPGAAPEYWMAPGLVDLQVNGYGGIDFQQDNLNLDDLLSATRQIRAAGCTRFLLTLITDKWPKLTARLRHLRMLRSKSPELLQSIIAGTSRVRFFPLNPVFTARTIPRSCSTPRPRTSANCAPSPAPIRSC